jgi:AcrR family transcriptional regulator
VPKARTLDRAQVVAAGADLADANGLEALTLAAVAQKVDVRIPSLYNHIDGLAALRREIGLLALRDLESLMTRAAAGRQGAAALGAIAEAYYHYSLSHPGRYLAAQRPADESDAEAGAAGARVIDLLRGVMKPFHLSARDEIHAVRGFRSLVHGFVSLNAVGGFGLPVEVERSLERNLAWFVAGLAESAKIVRRKR